MLTKGGVIFADQNQEEPQTNHPVKDVILSHDEYRNIVKEAYKEGLQDAVKKNVSPDKQEDEKKDDDEEKKQNQEGKAEAVKQHAQDMQESKKRLEAIAERHDVEIMRVQTVFPFTFFPDTLIIDTTKVTIVKKQMFATEEVITVPLKDLSDTHVQTALFLASLNVKYLPHSNNPGMLKPVEVQINSLRREDAIRAKNILKGILIASSEDIDLAKLTPEEIVNIVEKFGTSEGVT